MSFEKPSLLLLAGSVGLVKRDIMYAKCVCLTFLCVCRTRRQHPSSVRPGCDERVEVGGDGAEPCTADTGQSQEGVASTVQTSDSFYLVLHICIFTSTYFVVVCNHLFLFCCFIYVTLPCCFLFILFLLACLHV